MGFLYRDIVANKNICIGMYWYLLASLCENIFENLD
jgi:hypothetical protein